jgi:hypothetical protein
MAAPVRRLAGRLIRYTIVQRFQLGSKVVTGYKRVTKTVQQRSHPLIADRQFSPELLCEPCHRMVIPLSKHSSQVVHLIWTRTTCSKQFVAFWKVHPAWLPPSIQWLTSNPSTANIKHPCGSIHTSPLAHYGLDLSLLVHSTQHNTSHAATAPNM